MRRITLLLAIFLGITAMSCTQSTSKETQQPSPAELTQFQVNRLRQDAANISSNGAVAMPVSSSAVSQTPVQPGATANPTINPPHGQPGHRCDIPVGSPLPVAQAAAPAQRLNPPHGQPGHRCDIPVGSPLP